MGSCERVIIIVYNNRILNCMVYIYIYNGTFHVDFMLAGL